MNSLGVGGKRRPCQKREKLVSSMVQARGLANWQQPPIDPTSSALEI